MPGRGPAISFNAGRCEAARLDGAVDAGGAAPRPVHAPAEPCRARAARGARPRRFSAGSAGRADASPSCSRPAGRPSRQRAGVIARGDRPRTRAARGGRYTCSPTVCAPRTHPTCPALALVHLLTCSRCTGFVFSQMVGRKVCSSRSSSSSSNAGAVGVAVPAIPACPQLGSCLR